jgi:DNA-binding transcriptional MerR regulator
MSNRRLTIGSVARRTGIPVKTLRFYSDEGLLPPADRTDSGYRLYTEADLVRVDLIRTLRDAGLDLATIRSVLQREMTLGDALRLRLRAVEAHVLSLQQVAAAIRAALRTDPDEDDIRRLCAVTRLTSEGRKAMIEGFFEEVCNGIPIDETWKQQMIETSTCELPDEPTREQLDAWIELTELMSNRELIASLRAHAAAVWTPDFDVAAMQRANSDAERAARDALARNVSPASAEAAAVVATLTPLYAAAHGREPNQAFRDWMRAQYENHDPRGARYWELLSIVKGVPAQTGPTAEWAWLVAAFQANPKA